MGFAAAVIATQAIAADPADRLVADLRQANPAVEWPSADTLRSACDRDRRCYAEHIVGAQPDDVRLVTVRHPDTDTIRWVRTAPSVAVEIDRSGISLRIGRFGRKVVREVEQALDQLADEFPVRPISVDLTANRGGDVKRMLEVAGMLVGPRLQAVLIDGVERHWRDLPGEEAGNLPAIATVRVGPATASSAEVLAALLYHYGGATLCGEGVTAGQAMQKHLVAVDHAIRLVVSTAHMRVPPVGLDGGLRPERVCD